MRQKTSEYLVRASRLDFLATWKLILTMDFRDKIVVLGYKKGQLRFSKRQQHLKLCE